MACSSKQVPKEAQAENSLSWMEHGGGTVKKLRKSLIGLTSAHERAMMGKRLKGGGKQ